MRMSVTLKGSLSLLYLYEYDDKSAELSCCHLCVCVCACYQSAHSLNFDATVVTLQYIHI